MMIKTWMNQTHRLARKAAISLVTCVAVTAMTPMLFAQAKAPAVLNLVPADSEIVVVVPSLSALNQKLAALNAAMGGVVPWMGDTLGEIKRGTGMVNGVNDEGGIAVIMNNIMDTREAEGEEMPVLVLIPVNDYNAFVANFNAQAADDGVTSVTFTQGSKGFIRQVEGYALLSPTKALVQAYKPGNAGPTMLKKAGKLGGQYVSSSDFVIITDMSILGPKLKPKFDEAMKEAKAELENDPNAAQGSPVDPQVVMKVYEDATASLISSSEMLVIGLDLSELGIGLTYAAQFKEGSDVAKMFKPSDSSAAKLLGGVAQKPYMFAVSQNLESIDLSKIINTVADVLKGSSPEAAKMITAALPLFEQTKGMTSTYYPGQMNLAGGLFNAASMVATDDPAAYVKAFRNYLDTLATTQLPIQLPADENGNAQPPANIAFFTQYNANTTTVEGVAIDQYELRYDLPPAMLAKINPQLMMLTGMSAQRGYVAQVNGKVIITGTADLPTLTEAIKAAKAGNGLNADQGVTQVRKQLTNNADFEAYLNLGTIANTALGFAQAMGQQIDIQVPADLPPIGYSMSIDDNGVAARTYVPISVIKLTRDVYFTMAPLFGGMMPDDGGQQQGGGGGPPRR